jgi:hypothetical protein
MALLALIAGAPAASAKPAFFAVSNESACLANQDVTPFLHQHHANVLRLILAPQDTDVGAGIACVADAYAAGFKVYLSLQFNNRWSPRQVAAYFNRVLPSYAPYLWAIGVGNEQDLTTQTGYGQGTRALTSRGSTAGKRYRAVWNAVEPILVKVAPQAIRAYGEFSPWSFAANQQGFASGRPPGVQAIAAHCYHTRVGGLLQVPQDAAWAASKHLPLWCSEMGPALARPTTTRWAVHDTWGSWNALVAKIERKSPDLKMTGYYYFPGF